MSKETEELHHVAEELYHVAESICQLSCVQREALVQRKTEFDWLKSHAGLATKQDLELLGNKIMATQAEIVADLRASIVSLKQVNVDIKDTQTAVNELKAKIVELEALVAAGGSITPELVEAVAEVKTLAAAADEALPNTVVVPPPA